MTDYTGPWVDFFTRIGAKSKDTSNTHFTFNGYHCFIVKSGKYAKPQDMPSPLQKHDYFMVKVIGFVPIEARNILIKSDKIQFTAEPRDSLTANQKAALNETEDTILRSFQERIPNLSKEAIIGDLVFITYISGLGALDTFCNHLIRNDIWNNIPWPTNMQADCLHVSLYIS